MPVKTGIQKVFNLIGIANKIKNTQFAGWNCDSIFRQLCTWVTHYFRDRKYLSNNSLAFSSPSTVTATDFALFFGSKI